MIPYSHLPGILASRWRSAPAKHHYWVLRQHLTRWKNIGLLPEFSDLAWRDHWNFFTHTVHPVSGACDHHADLAATWLITAWRATPDDGVSLGCFPSEATPWRPSYPETTGYIISSLVHYAEHANDGAFRDAAHAMARWEAAVQMPSGAVQGGPVVAADRQTPAVFNTGMVLDGFCTLLETTADNIIQNAARKAADFLLRDQGDDGHFRTHGDFVTHAPIKTYNCLCAWSLYRFGQLINERGYCQAALHAAQASMNLQTANGWFPHNCLTRPDAPLTHTIGYTLQGLLETGLAAGREDLVTSAARGMTPMLGAITRQGFLPGRFHADWTPASFSSCLTGNAQLAVVCFRLHQALGDRQFLDAANRLTDFLKGVQVTDYPCTPMQGALAGSFPMFLGEYMTAGFPNWATKYLLDALLLQSATRDP
ncbi:MAG: hypothetical protein HQM03_00550 [Magnetococcales bacterium]|nr:hypothetical protein [Magnetococcales bacterium]